MRIGMIAAVAHNGIIGIDGRIPWRHPADMRRFKEVTTGQTVIMGRKTFASMGGKPLPKRKNIVVTRTPIDGILCTASLQEALALAEGEAWIIGGAKLYEEGMRFADTIDLVRVPDAIEDVPHAVHFPAIPPEFIEESCTPLDQGLISHIYRRKT